MASGGMPACSCPSTAIVRCRAAGRSASLTASSASSTPTMRDPADRCSASHRQASLPVQCTQAGRRSVFPRTSASGTHGRRGTARQAPTASQVRRRVPRLAPCMGHSGAAMRRSQHRCPPDLRCRAISRRARTRICGPLTSPAGAPWRKGHVPHYSLSWCFAAHLGRRREITSTHESSHRDVFQRQSKATYSCRWEFNVGGDIAHRLHVQDHRRSAHGGPARWRTCD